MGHRLNACSKWQAHLPHASRHKQSKHYWQDSFQLQQQQEQQWLAGHASFYLTSSKQKSKVCARLQKLARSIASLLNMMPDYLGTELNRQQVIPSIYQRPVLNSGHQPKNIHLPTVIGISRPE